MEKKEKSSGRTPLSIIGDAIHSETIKKELRNFKLNEVYMLSPSAIKNLVLTNKPTDPPIIATHRVEKQQTQKRDEKSIPRTTNSYYGWDTVPLKRVHDRRFYHPKLVTEITKMYGSPVVPKEKEKEKT